jgi:Glu-tRNA(Gln) amidotransferase subunit E-like FAD-binding protein
MTSKNKKVYHSPEYFSQKYEDYYNSSMYSDIKIKFEESEKVILCHKIVLMSSSEYFEKIIKNMKGDTITIPKEENEELFKEFLKFLYKGSIDYSNIKELIAFLTYSEKYGLKDLKEYKDLAQKDVLEGIIYYIKEDFQNRFEEFDKLIEKQINFKKISQEELLKIYLKNKWLQHSPVFLNQIVKKEINDDTEYTYTITKFIPNHVTSNISLSKGNTVATYTGSSYNWSKYKK